MKQSFLLKEKWVQIIKKKSTVWVTLQDHFSDDFG